MLICIPHSTLRVCARVTVPKRAIGIAKIDRVNMVRLENNETLRLALSVFEDGR